MSGSFYRFVRTGVESMSALKGNNSWYSIADAQGEPVFACHVEGSCLGGTSTFHSSPEDEAVLFRLEPKRKFLNLTYYVCEGATGPRIATLELFVSRGMKVSDAGGREQYRVVDARGKLDKFVEGVMEGACGEYALVADDKLIGSIERRDRPEEPKPERKGLLGFVGKVLSKALLRDWCIDLAEEGKLIEDHRPLVAGMVLLLEQTISSDQTH